ncbi:MAG TPA: molecular chaperone DnaJ [Thermodesulfobacteriota bacterium]|nr:molecular chaperone DnaJ [Thermodesulfobacteriota bacterium]
MTSKNYYEILGLTRNSTQDEIKKAYKKLAFEYHPDRNPGDPEAEERFKEINEAYQILNNPEKRAKYDSLSQMSGESFFDVGFTSNFNDIFEDLFDQVFNVGRRRRPERGRDLRYDLELTFEEAASGVEKEITIPKAIPCSDCGGRGAAPGGEVRCNVCSGTGTIKYSEGFFSMSRSCPSCKGMGTIIKEHCPTCDGHGFVSSDHKVKVKVPAGIDQGMRLKIRGEGEVGFYGGPSGDLYVKIHIQEHPFFKRDGKDVFCEVPVSFVQAVLGAETIVPTLEGKDTIQIPPGTQPGQTFKLKGRGVPSLNGEPKGDLYVKIQVEVPVRISQKQRRLLEEFAKVSEENDSPITEGFFEKLREFFG